MILDVALFGSNGTDPPAVFLHRLDEKHPLSEDVFLVNQFQYLTKHPRIAVSEA
jgi:putative transposase